MLGICWLAEELLASQEILCSVELVSYKNTLGVALVEIGKDGKKSVLLKDAIHRCD